MKTLYLEHTNKLLKLSEKTDSWRKKMGKRFWHFTKDLWMAHKHMERCSTSKVNRETQIKQQWDTTAHALGWLWSQWRHFMWTGSSGFHKREPEHDHEDPVQPKVNWTVVRVPFTKALGLMWVEYGVEPARLIPFFVASPSSSAKFRSIMYLEVLSVGTLKRRTVRSSQ